MLHTVVAPSCAAAAEPRPVSAVSGGVGVAGMVGLLAWVAVARHFGMDGPYSALTNVVACGAPMVAFRGRFMRGRFAGGILDELGLGEHVAETPDAFVAAVDRLHRDAALRASLRSVLLRDGRGLFERAEDARSMQDWLLSAA